MDYQPFYTINLLLDKELLPIQKMPKLGIKEHEIVKISKKRGLSVFPDSKLSRKQSFLQPKLNSTVYKLQHTKVRWKYYSRNHLKLLSIKLIFINNKGLIKKKMTIFSLFIIRYTVFPHIVSALEQFPHLYVLCPKVTVHKVKFKKEQFPRKLYEEIR